MEHERLHQGQSSPPAPPLSAVPDGCWLDARELLEVVQAVRDGDFSARLPGNWSGPAGKFADAFNAVVMSNSRLAAELRRVGQSVGRHGNTRERVRGEGQFGAWGEVAASVNLLIDDLLWPTTEMSRSIAAVARGDLSRTVPLESEGHALEGEFLRSARIVNRMIEQMRVFTSEVTRVAREVGADGKLGGQAEVKDVSGVWKDLTDNVNSMANNLTGQVRNISEVTIAVANGDLSRKITVDVRGEILQLKETINTMVDQLRSFASEVTRVAREVGTEGKLGGQANVPGAAGIWEDLTDNVNSMAGNLTAQVRNIAEVATAIARGDLSRKITVDVRGEILELKETVNTMVDQLNGFAAEVTRVAREVGTDGKLGGQARVPGVAGTWKDLTDNVNWMAGNLTAQVRNIAEVATAIANGDLSRKITVDVRGEILELKETVNTMVDQLNGFAAEVTRVAREVGTDGKLGGQAQVPGVAGTWKDLTDNVNSMAGNLTGQVRNIAEVATAVARGDLSRKITVDVKGEILQLKDTINTMVDQLNGFASEVTRVAREVGTEGKLGGHAQVPGVAGTWKDLTDNVNWMAGNLTAQVRNIAEVATAIARGDLSHKITVDVRGEILQLKNTINTMVDQLNGFAAEVTRVAREVGTEGKLGGQAQVPGVAGIWEDLTDNVNVMAANLTSQVRGIVKVVTAVADGDLGQKLTVQSQGEIAALADTINSMTDTLATFADQVTTVAREVGVEGRLGGQANVPGASGTWKDLTANVNLLAANLTTQVRAIADVATAVTEGDLTRYIQVEAKGEVDDLKNYINAMIGNLRKTTERNTEQDWLKTNLARLSRMLQGQRDLYTVARLLLSELAPLVDAQQGAMYMAVDTERGPRLRKVAGFADATEAEAPREYVLGEGLVGQCAYERHRMIISDIPDHSIRIVSGAAELRPSAIMVLPVLFEGQVMAVIELASLRPFTPTHIALLEQLADVIGIVLNTIAANMRTESLLQQSQQLAAELQTQQRELQQTNEELAQQAQLLATQNAEVERKNQEIEHARRAVEEKAAELALTSRYKSEFLANMSHELRTPLNSILILGQQLADNADGNLTPRQVEFAGTIRAAGTDLLNLISDILDLSKVESGTVTVEYEPLPFAGLAEALQRGFRHEAEARGLAFDVEFDEALGGAMRTDPKRLLQVLKNLLSNAFKFTESGAVRVRAARAEKGWTPGHALLDKAPVVVAFAVSDTGIGIPPDKQKIIFEAFQQADAGTARQYGGTGLGLAISRELARLLGGEICLQSAPGRGSTFTLYLPLDMEPPEARKTAAATAAPPQPVTDDREALQAGDPVLLIVEGDVQYARMLLDLARETGFKAVLAHGGADGLALIRQYVPAAVLLDALLPDMSGWSVLSQIKHDLALRHIPVQMDGTADVDAPPGLARSAFAHVDKPATAEALRRSLARLRELSCNRARRLLVVGGRASGELDIARWFAGDDVAVTTTESGAEGLREMRAQTFDCVVLGPLIADPFIAEVLTRIRDEPQLHALPIVVSLGPDQSAQDEARLRALAPQVGLKLVRSPERLLDEILLVLHRPVADLPEAKRRLLERLHDDGEILANRKVLVVDDDARNTFALSSLLERHRMEVLAASNGRAAIELIQGAPDLSLVLIDIMMPEMDGYETMRRIRRHPTFSLLPIIALTAKAMKGDREKCLEAGASDYIAKPVDNRHLLSVLRTWLHP